MCSEKISKNEIELHPVAIEDKPILRNLMELCQHDASQFNKDDIDQHGLFGYKYIDHYWTESGRHPFLVKVQGKIAGLVLVRLSSEANSIAEFFILRKYRRKGVGREVATRVFDLFPGTWNVRQEAENKQAQAFWKDTIAAYTGGNFKEIQNPTGEDPIQIFQAPANSTKTA